MIYRASDRDDLRRLANDIRDVPGPNRPTLVAAINAAGLMKGPLWWRLAARLVQLRHWCSLFDAYYRIYRAPHPKAPQVVDALLDDTARHAQFGDDREDEDSVGGFSQREIDILATILEKVS
jgi:hypothetical protein